MSECRFVTISDLAAAVRGAVPDAEAVGVDITDEHVGVARHEAGVRYEDISEADFDTITERAVMLARLLQNLNKALQEAEE